MTVTGVAYTSLATGDSSKYTETVQYYRKLGFTLIRSFDRNISQLSSSKGVAHDSLKETWLESFKLGQFQGVNRVPLQESNSIQSEGVVVKIRLTTADVVVATGDGASVHLGFFTTNLEKVSSVLGAAIEDGQVVSHDPLGNSLTFVTFPNPLTGTITGDYFHEQPLPKSVDIEDLAAPTQKKKKKIAVMTSGGDSQGMNAVVRAVVRAGIFYGCDVFAVYEGYTGLVKGGDLLKKMEWDDVRGWLALGGTLIGTARCAEFRERWGRVAGAKNMIDNGIDSLIVCGGDGSLTGADLFRAEWPSLLDELVETKQITKEKADLHRHLTIVGLVGSIDNDMSGTDTTIGAASSLERITEMVDYIDATATSHSRAFVVEVMGRHCGWLALNAGITTGADYIFVPERAADSKTWREELKEVCARHRAKGRRTTTVIVAEGALDSELNPVTPEDVKDVLVDLGLDTRITTLGHVQRGGTAVAYDRLLATMQGVEAVKAVLDLTPSDPSPLIGILENKIIRTPLVEAVKQTKKVASAIEARDFDTAINLRSNDFLESYSNFLSLSQGDDGKQILPEDKRLNIAIVHVGASSAGLNAATRAATLYCLSRGHTPYAIQNGFSGLIRHGSVEKLSWGDVAHWHNTGASDIGTNRTLPSMDIGAVAFYFQKYHFDGLIIIGGFEGFTSLHELSEARKEFPVFNIPMTLIPATVSNNVPGTEYSLGCDTCLNSLVGYCDAVKQSASSSRRRVFVVEVQGGHSGYIASYIGLVTGAVAVYLPEKKITLRTIQEDISLLKENFTVDQGLNRTGKLLIRNETASDIFTTSLIADIIGESSKKFETRTAVPGHVQQGGAPSSQDRVNASRFAIKCCKFIEEWNERINSVDLEGSDKYLRFKYVDGRKVSTVGDNTPSAAVIGVKGSELKFTSIEELWEHEADVKLRKSLNVHWEEINEVSDVLSGRLILRNRILAEKEEQSHAQV
ncbi:6-phosphofructokinase subunit alpha [Cyberlindnera jadinii NRRL Y-1542]|uniref:ATP-dependent 6-phosphofructokinase n=1 Tax=Cyberlindnera jadinii (strain ATCC 18201 / CBS 1600 / BCRC 20928 / JCM 3617 / NBRC 0987 / NRRL Y-1542) TaxID=983966 RepID=A0A1E4S9Y0_CYBJN|nr:6-phosphofructokinase [Cyberlindnera jadinii NRRL Y-1542]ODV76337.1 6-phosphofructokinase [Cyberlindnera jadinii NRRL Y-1542]